MPNRILRDYSDSMRFDGISAEAERLFIRLIIKADDYGRYHAEPRLVRAGCYPLYDTLRTNDLTRWLDELSTRQLILRYETQGRALLAIINFGQRLKASRAKFPPPEGKPGDFLPLVADFREVPGSSRKFPSEAEAEAESETETKSRSAGAPTAVNGEEWLAALKADSTYGHIQIDREMGKMRQWLALPKNKARQLTRQFALNWLNKIEPPLNETPKTHELPKSAGPKGWTPGKEPMPATR